MNDSVRELRKRLFELADAGYRDFHSRLMPTIDKEKIIGVRTPDLRRLAKDYKNTDASREFITVLPHEYYEENNLHAFFLEQCGDFDVLAGELDRFLPYVDNWATCDLMKPKIFKKHLSELLNKIKQWISAKDTYTVRFGIGMLMTYYLDNEFSPEYPELVCFVRSDEYYIKMMVAWYFATALAKQYESVVPYIEHGRLEPWTHNKAIQKAIESRRITPEQKEYLRSLKVKKA